MSETFQNDFAVPNCDPWESSLTDEELLLKYRRTGDRSLFAQLVRRYQSELYSFLRRFLGNAEMAEDAFQAAFLQVHLKANQFEEGRRFRPWLYAIGTNQAIDAQRRNKRHRIASLDRPATDDADMGLMSDLLEAESVDPLNEISRLEQGAWVRGAVEGLSEQMRSVVHLVYYQGLSYREAAESLGIPVGTVKSRLHTAIARLTVVWNESHVEQVT